MATLALIGEHGSDAVTHRAVAGARGLPLSATTYWFASKEDLLQEAVAAGRATRSSGSSGSCSTSRRVSST